MARVIIFETPAGSTRYALECTDGLLGADGKWIGCIPRNVRDAAPAERDDFVDYLSEAYADPA